MIESENALCIRVFLDISSFMIWGKKELRMIPKRKTIGHWIPLRTETKNNGASMVA